MSNASTSPAVDVGVGRVLKQIRDPSRISGPLAVEFRGVTKTYNAGHRNAATAICDVTFAVEDLSAKGEFVCILGPSGCGKSTILRLIAGLDPQHPPTRGEVLVLGRNVTGPGADRGMVFQDYTSFDNRTVLDNVAFGLECAGVSRRLRYELARDWIARVGLKVGADQYKYPHELSGGMRQRVAIARTLILRPRLILMDEPFGALDPMTRILMQDLLVSLCGAAEATVFFVTHSIEEAVYLGDRVYILSGAPGTLVRELEVGPPDRPAAQMQREPDFQQTVYYIRDLIRDLETGVASAARPSPLRRRRAAGHPVLTYLKAAFWHHWNLLAFLGGMGFAALSGQPEVGVPLVLAGEAAYLGFLSTHSKFQSHVDAQQAKSARQEGSERNVVTLTQLRKALPERSSRRYEDLLAGCRKLRKIALDLKQPGMEASLDSMQIEGLDRLLWIFLRLLFTEYSLTQFLEQTSREDIARDAQRIEAQLAKVNPKDQSPHAAKIRRTLEDSLKTARDRLENYSRAQSNHEFAQLEIARLENKIKSLAELAVNRQEPDYISSQIDQVAHSMLDTERTMNELQYVTGLDPSDEHIPSILTATEQATR